MGGSLRQKHFGPASGDGISDHVICDCHRLGWIQNSMDVRPRYFQGVDAQESHDGIVRGFDFYSLSLAYIFSFSFSSQHCRLYLRGSDCLRPIFVLLTDLSPSLRLLQHTHSRVISIP
jgi:hypothetical protein